MNGWLSAKLFQSLERNFSVASYFLQVAFVVFNVQLKISSGYSSCFASLFSLVFREKLVISFKYDVEWEEVKKEKKRENFFHLMPSSRFSSIIWRKRQQCVNEKSSYVCLKFPPSPSSESVSIMCQRYQNIPHAHNVVWDKENVNEICFCLLLEINISSSFMMIWL